MTTPSKRQPNSDEIEDVTPAKKSKSNKETKEYNLGFIDISEKSASEVWKHFKCNKSIKKAICKVCCRVLDSKHGTKSLINHCCEYQTVILFEV